MKTKNRFQFVIVVLSLTLMSSLTVRAEDAPSAGVKVQANQQAVAKSKDATAKIEPTPEMRKKMADMHQTMANCLNSDKPLGECRQEMMTNCSMMKETGQCPMMGGMEGMGGMRGRKGRMK